MKKRIINMMVLPGQPPEVVAKGAGKICIHLFVPDPHGPFTEHHVLQIDKVKAMHGKQALFNGPVQGRLACDRKRLVVPVTKNNVTTVAQRTDDPRAVTCPKCEASPDYARIMKVIDDAAAGVAATEPEQNSGE